MQPEDYTNKMFSLILSHKKRLPLFTEHYFSTILNIVFLTLIKIQCCIFEESSDDFLVSEQGYSKDVISWNVVCHIHPNFANYKVNFCITLLVFLSSNRWHHPESHDKETEQGIYFQPSVNKISTLYKNYIKTITLLNLARS